MNLPFFSILIPSYNRPNYLGLTIDSVIKSSFKNFELIISDDNSPKSSEIKNLVKSYNDSRIVFFNQKKNLGEANNRQFLIDKSKAKWKIILSDDDLLSSNALKVLNNNISQNTEIDLFLFGYNLIDQFGKVLYKRKSFRRIRINSKKISLVKILLKFDIFPYRFFSPVTFCFSENLSKKIKSSNKVGIADDIVFLADVILNDFKGLVIPMYLMSYRKLFSSAGLDDQKNQSSSLTVQLKSKKLVYAYLIEKYKNHPIFYSYLKSLKYKFDFLLINYCNKKAYNFYQKEIKNLSFEENSIIENYKKSYNYNFIKTKILRLIDYLKISFEQN